MNVEIMRICMKILDIADIHVNYLSDIPTQEDLHEIRKYLFDLYRIACQEENYLKMYTSHAYHLAYTETYTIRKDEKISHAIRKIIDWTDPTKVDHMDSTEIYEMYMMLYTAMCMIMYEMTSHVVPIVSTQLHA